MNDGVCICRVDGLGIVGAVSGGDPTTLSIRDHRCATDDGVHAPGDRVERDHVRIAGDFLDGRSRITAPAIVGAGRPVADAAFKCAGVNVGQELGAHRGPRCHDRPPRTASLGCMTSLVTKYTVAQCVSPIIYVMSLCPTRVYHPPPISV
ncbi:hypothetical protein KTR9_0164 [Gordonia sp. KTR9]|nr:hypothetical protein KTR9_0164 [Gordonia sp. KTR9]